METDHKSLIPVLRSKNLYDMSPKIQQFRMRLIRYSYHNVHDPVKENFTANALSKAPLYSKLTKAEKQLNEDINLYIASII